MDLDALSDRNLLDLHCRLMELLRQRGVVRSSNNPVADYTETLVARALGATLEANSKAGYDAIGIDGTRFQIKGRRLTPANRSTQLSAIRNLDRDPFDQLAAVVYNSNLVVQYAALIPLGTVRMLSRYRAHTNAHTLHFRRALLDEASVTDITSTIQAAADA